MGNKAQTGGILTIISGGIGVLGSLIAFAFIPLIRTSMSDPQFQDPNLTVAEIDMAIDLVVGMTIFFAIVGLLFSVFAIVAGVMATRRKAWTLGLAGSIVSLFLFFPTGVPAIIFIAMARPEFSPPTAPVPPPPPATATLSPPPLVEPTTQPPAS
jgi:hypothetical protein